MSANRVQRAGFQRYDHLDIPVENSGSRHGMVSRYRVNLAPSCSRHGPATVLLLIITTDSTEQDDFF